MATAILYGGFDSGVVSGVNTLPACARDYGVPDKTKPGDTEWLISAKWLSIWEGVSPLGAILGSVAGGWLLDRIGRKLCFMLGSILGASAILVILVSSRPEGRDTRCTLMLVGKVGQGFGLGIIKNAAFTYLSEIVPVSLKSGIMTLVPIMTLLGQLFGAVISFLVSKIETTLSYQIPFGSQFVVALPPFILGPFPQESPVYLINKKKPQKAYELLTRLYGPKHDAAAILRKFEVIMKGEAKTAAKISYLECFKAANRRRTLVILLASSIEMMFGLPLLSTVSLYLKVLGMPSSRALLFLVAGIVVGLMANIGSAWVVSHIGRRKLTTTSLLIVSIIYTIMGFSRVKPISATPWIAGGCVIGVVISDGPGAWPASWANIGETSSLRLRSKSQGLGSLCNHLVMMAMSALLPFLFNHDAADLGAKTGFVFTALSFFGTVMTYFFVPELKIRSMAEIDRLFESGVSARKWTQWRNTHENIPMTNM